MDGEGGQRAEQLQETCIECEDQHAELVCLSCDEPFCRPCWGSLHRQGKRAEHVTRAILGDVMPAPVSRPEPPAPVRHQAVALSEVEGEGESELLDSEEGAEIDSHVGDVIDDSDVANDSDVAAGNDRAGLESGVGADEGADDNVQEAPSSSGEREVPKGNGKRRAKRKPPRELAVGRQGFTVLEECRFIPLRLNERERGLLAMLKGALNVSEYTDRVDVFSRWGSKSKTINNELRLALALLSGMMVAGEGNWGHKSVALLDTLEKNQDAFAEIFEVGRRYKITNPEKFRTFYGKMQFMLQDAQAQGRPGLNLVKDIQASQGHIGIFVEEREGLEMLKDERVLAATVDVSGRFESKAEVQQQMSAKVEARAGLLQDYVSGTFLREDVERVLDSIADANNYLAFNVSPVERMLTLLRKNFHPDKPGEWSLRLMGGRKRNSSSSSSMYGYSYGYSYGGGYGSSMFGGSSTAMLSHDHRTQYTFVMQSLRLWSEAMRNMYRLWYFADRDLVSGKASYRLSNTGQGLNRVQSCPSVSGEMRRILGIVQSECGPWVGLSVVHLGDRDVPNALVFIDKYTQIPRILSPIVEAVRSLEDMALDPVLGNYVDVGWGGVRNAKMAILSDFFKGGFDGSGDDGGSCIDGRLTSAWNWCSLLPKKPFAPIFHLAGQYGFDGGWSTGLAD
ncbi:unnamed protein product [Ascophyllum nodosum]